MSNQNKKTFRTPVTVCGSRMRIFPAGILMAVMGLMICLPVDAQNIYAAVYAGDMDAVRSLLKENSQLVNRQDRSGRTPLYFAVLGGHQEMAGFLIEQGAVVRTGDHNLRAPIHMAGFMDDIPMAELLLENGAVVDTRAIGAATPLIHSSLADRFNFSRFLIERGADINVQCNSLTTPLYFAVLNDNRAFLNYMLDKGADLDTPDFLGRTPLAIAVRDGFAEISALLIKTGADFETQDPYLHRSLLHLAAIHGHVSSAEQLIRAGLEINGEDEKGFTPLDYAERYGHAALAGFLREKGGRTGHGPSPMRAATGDFQDVKSGDAVLVKLRNGSWGIVTERCFLILAYSEIGNLPQDPSLRSGYLPGHELSDRRWYYLDLSFRPAAPAYSLQGRNPLYERADEENDLTFILNESLEGNYSALNLARAVFPKPAESMDIDELRITMVPSYKTKIGFLIQCDGLTIFWLSGLTDDYNVSLNDTRALDFFEDFDASIDLLFLGLPDGIGPEKGNGIRESYLQTRKLNAGAVFFMGKEPLARRVRRQILRRIDDPGHFGCAENPGDRFFFSHGTLKKESGR